MTDHASHFIDVLQAGKPGGLQGHLGAKGCNEYLTRLAGYSLASLTSEPSRIADEANFVQRELTGLCSRESKTFIDVHACSSSISNALDDFSASLDDLFAAIPELEDECLSFAKSTRGLQLDRERASVILDQQDSLLDLLEVPQLVDTCVRNGYYQEAMELTAYINQVAQNHPDLVILRSVARSTESVMDMQLSQLLALLRESIKLPVMAKTIGFLRRMNRLSEEEIRMVFLESRVDHMRQSVAALQSEKVDKIRYLRRYIDLFREVVYETVSQYNSIFLNSGNISPGSRRDEGALDLVARYVQHNVHSLIAVIEEHLAGIQDSSSLSSLLTQLGYGTMSFARLGIDFTSLLRNPFEKAVETLVVMGWQSATDQVLDKFEEATRMEIPPGSWLCSEEGKAFILTDRGSPPERPDMQNPPVPPGYLALFPPLAIYLNHGLSTLNSLRLLAPIKSQSRTNQALRRSFGRLSQRFLSYALLVTEDRLKPSSKRPDSMRRNTSISNQGQLLEQDRARTIETKRVLIAAADAMLGVLFPFLLASMEDVVYGSGAVAGNAHGELVEAAGLKDWLSKNAELPEPSARPNPIAPGEEAEAEPDASAGLASVTEQSIEPAEADPREASLQVTDATPGETGIQGAQDLLHSTTQEMTPSGSTSASSSERKAARRDIALTSTTGNSVSSTASLTLEIDREEANERKSLAVKDYDFTQTEDSVIVVIPAKKTETVGLAFANGGVQLKFNGVTNIDLSPLYGAFKAEEVSSTIFRKKVEVLIPKAVTGEIWPKLIV